MSANNIGFLREIRKKMSIFGQIDLGLKVDFDHLLVYEHVIKFNNFTTLPYRRIVLAPQSS